MKIRKQTVSSISDVIYKSPVRVEPTSRLGAMCGGLGQIALANGTVVDDRAVPLPDELAASPYGHLGVPLATGISPAAGELVDRIVDANLIR